MAEKRVEKDAATKVARQRLSVLEMAETLGNISEACRRGGMDRTSFYEWKRRFQTHGLEGLKDMPPIPKSQPNQTTPETEAAILECSFSHPSWGCVKLSDFLKLQGVAVSSPTVQKILIRNDMASVYDRWLKVEERHLETGVALTADQVAKIEKYNPCFKERHVESSRPGELLSQDTVPVSLLTAITETNAVWGVIAFRTSWGSTLPSVSTGRYVTTVPCSSMNLQLFKIAACSIAVVMIWFLL